MTTTVSAKIPDRLKRELDDSGVNVSTVIRDALEAEVRRRRREELTERAENLRRELAGKLDTDDVVEAIRDDRRNR